jgi:hypothetical protein
LEPDRPGLTAGSVNVSSALRDRRHDSCCDAAYYDLEPDMRMGAWLASIFPGRAIGASCTRRASKSRHRSTGSSVAALVRTGSPAVAGSR